MAFSCIAKKSKVNHNVEMVKEWEKDSEFIDVRLMGTRDICGCHFVNIGKNEKLGSLKIRFAKKLNVPKSDVAFLKMYNCGQLIRDHETAHGLGFDDNELIIIKLLDEEDLQFEPRVVKGDVDELGKTVTIEIYDSVDLTLSRPVRIDVFGSLQMSNVIHTYTDQRGTLPDAFTFIFYGHSIQGFETVKELGLRNNDKIIAYRNNNG